MLLVEVADFHLLKTAKINILATLHIFPAGLAGDYCFQ
jgi:hypothetical protein